MEGLFFKHMTHISIVIPVLNESSIIFELIRRVKLNVENINNDYEIIIVDDGSTDNTWNLISASSEGDRRVKGLKLSRNFGQHYAITAGLHHAKGKWVVVMDGDLQDRPEVIPELYAKVQQGFDVVFVSRESRPESRTYLVLQRIYYIILRKLSGINFDSRQANFSIISGEVVDAFKKFPESSRFFVSTIKWLGFNQTSINANHGIRFAGTPSYSIRKRLKLASDVIFSFSVRPLMFSVYFGALVASASVVYLFFIAGYRFFKVDKLDDLSSVWGLIGFFGGSNIFVLGLTGLYIGKIFEQVKNRPLFIISDSTNFPKINP
jgi:glycosyltransferase involved in cell wall biosynthesis